MLKCFLTSLNLDFSEILSLQKLTKIAKRMEYISLIDEQDDIYCLFPLIVFPVWVANHQYNCKKTEMPLLTMQLFYMYSTSHCHLLILLTLSMVAFLFIQQSF